ncbi:MAG: hypothetical protein P4L69_08350, partial [Desulfosporosinus sp.]|nr:hypothetical protein [Desulfosporosinus sp.]
ASVAIVVAHHPDQKVPDFLYISQPWPQWAWRSHLGPAFDVIGEPPNATAFLRINKHTALNKYEYINI